MARGMGQRHKHLSQTAAPFANIILHDGLLARETMFVAKALEDPLRRMALLAVNGAVLFQNTVNNICEGIQLRALRWLPAAVARRLRMPQHLLYSLARYAKPTCCFSLAQTFSMASQPNA